jgi:hypothetical protein
MDESQAKTSNEQPRTPEELIEELMRSFLEKERLGLRGKVSIPVLPGPKIVSAMFWAFLIVYVSYYYHTYDLPPVPEETLYSYYTLDALRQKLWEATWVTPVILWTFLFGMFYLLGIWVKKYKVLANNETSEFYQSVVNGQLALVRRKIETVDDPAVLGYYGARLHALVMRWNTDTDLPAVQALKNEILEIDEQNVAHTFVPVIWSETALPLLGFLGTVTGIGQAIGSIGEAIKLLSNADNSTGNVQLDTMFNAGFENMALAFDTTFFGLFFLLLLGVFHIVAKKSFANRFDNARRFYSLTLAQLPQGSTNVLVAGVSELIEGMKAMEGTLKIIDEDVELLEGTIKVIDEDATSYKNRVEGLVDQVIMEVPQFADIRKVLMKPMVQFALLEAKPAKEFQSYIQTLLKLQSPSWTTIALGLSSGREEGGMISLSESGKSWVATFGTALNEKNNIFECADSFTSIIPSMSLDAFLGVVHGTELRIGVLPADRTTDKFNISKLNIDCLIHLSPLSIGEDEVLTAKQSGISTHIYSIVIKADTTPERVIDLPSKATWSHWDAHSVSRTLMVAGSSDSGDSMIKLISLPKQHRTLHKGQRKDRPRKPRQEIIYLPGITKITQFQVLGPRQCVFTDEDGSLFYMDETRNQPIRLEHQNLPKSGIERILSNKKGWLAVISNSRISMWNCRRGGFIYPYEGESPPNTAVSSSNYSVSSEGRYLYNFADTLIVRWSFPRSAGDRS